MHLFPTGQGNVSGNPIEPVIKISGDPITISTMKEHIDHDVSAILRGEMTLEDARECYVAQTKWSLNSWSRSLPWRYRSGTCLSWT